MFKKEFKKRVKKSILILKNIVNYSIIRVITYMGVKDMKKYLFVLFTVMLLVLSACGGSTESNDAANKGSDESNESTDQTVTRMYISKIMRLRLKI